ncbi:MAG: DUF4159 domain-containing protein [Bradymonadia bacterium]
MKLSKKALSLCFATAGALCVALPAMSEPPQRRNRRQVQKRIMPQQLGNAGWGNNIQLNNELNNIGSFGRGGVQQAGLAGFDGQLSARAIQRAINDAAVYLESRQAEDGSIGEGSYARGGATALATLALLASGRDPVADPTLKRALDWLLGQEAPGGQDPFNNTYVRGIRANVWEYALRKAPYDDRFRKALKEDFDWLLEAMNDEGWRYNKQSRDWDNSCTQYGVLGIWAGTRAGLEPGPKFWEKMSAHFRKTQNSDGGWGYVQSSSSTPNMATAGLASLFLVFDMHHGRKAWSRENPQAFSSGEAAEVLTALERGMTWLGQSRGDKGNAYYLYGIERAGVASGRQRFGGEDWFEEGAKRALSQQRTDGSIPIGYTPEIGTALTTLFMVYGGAPTAFAKLSHGVEGADSTAWNPNPRDLANLSRALWSAYERPLNWTIVEPEALDTARVPVLFLSGAGKVSFSKDEITALRRYVQRGGTILAEPADGDEAYRASMETLLAEMFPVSAHPEAQLKPLSSDHGVYRVQPVTWRNGPPKLRGAGDGMRTFFFISEGYMSSKWQVNDVEDDAFALARNLLFYATDLGALEGRFSTALPPGKGAPEAGLTVQVARVKHGLESSHPSDWDAAPLLWSSVAPYVKHLSGVHVQEAEAVQLDKGALDPKKVRLLHLSGRRALNLSDAEAQSLKSYVEGGGTVLVEAWGGSEAFSQSARARLEGLLGQIEALDETAPLALGRFAGGSDLTTEAPITLAARKARGRGLPLHVINVGGRPGVVFSPIDLSAGATGVAIHQRQGYTPEGARRVLTNMVAWLGRGRS